MVRPLAIGLYRLREPTTAAEISVIEEHLGSRLSLVSVYRAWNRADIGDDIAWLNHLRQCPRPLLLTWEPWALPSAQQAPEAQPDFCLHQILDGRFDTYIRAFARQMRSFDQPLFLRPMHEMNGNWYPWCGTVNGNTPADYPRAWRHLRRLFRAEGADNIHWVWSPYVLSCPDDEGNEPEHYFPGESEIDWLALDGYNWGTSREWSRWQSFTNLFADAYAKLTALGPHPVMIAETACCETGGDKGAWIEEMWRSLQGKFPQVRQLVWFDEDKECDWRIASSAESLRAFHWLHAYIDPD